MKNIGLNRTIPSGYVAINTPRFPDMPRSFPFTPSSFITSTQELILFQCLIARLTWIHEKSSDFSDCDFTPNAFIWRHRQRLHLKNSRGHSFTNRWIDQSKAVCNHLVSLWNGQLAKVHHTRQTGFKVKTSTQICISNKLFPRSEVPWNSP